MPHRRVPSLDLIPEVDSTVRTSVQVLSRPDCSESYVQGHPRLQNTVIFMIVDARGSSRIGMARACYDSPGPYIHTLPYRESRLWSCDDSRLIGILISPLVTPPREVTIDHTQLLSAYAVKEPFHLLYSHSHLLILRNLLVPCELDHVHREFDLIPTTSRPDLI